MCILCVYFNCLRSVMFFCSKIFSNWKKNGHLHIFSHLFLCSRFPLVMNAWKPYKRWIHAQLVKDFLNWDHAAIIVSMWWKDVLPFTLRPKTCGISLLVSEIFLVHIQPKRPDEKLIFQTIRFEITIPKYL